jgi:Holliday junction resolvase RusA-like endonuclease
MSRNLPTFARIEDIPNADWQAQARAALGVKPNKPRKPQSKPSGSPAPIPVSGSRINPDGSILLVIPHPPRSCSPNARVHWTTLRTAKKRLAEWTNDAITEAFHLNKRPNWKLAYVTIFWFHKKGKQPDHDNAISSCKAAIDQLQKSGIIENDRGVTMLPPECKVDGVQPRVEILIRELKV